MSSSTMEKDRFAQKTQRPFCTKCEYYYVTWEKGTPHGCKAMGFKSRNYPNTIALHVSGIRCQMFKSKERTVRLYALQR